MGLHSQKVAADIRLVNNGNGFGDGFRKAHRPFPLVRVHLVHVHPLKLNQLPLAQSRKRVQEKSKNGRAEHFPVSGRHNEGYTLSAQIGGFFGTTPHPLVNFLQA